MSEPGILIIGGGIAGAATAWHLAQRGAQGVILLEREPDFGAHATSQNAAILRTFTEKAATTALAHETAALLVDAAAWQAQRSMAPRSGWAASEADASR